jgi:hypothetical protein
MCVGGPWLGRVEAYGASVVAQTMSTTVATEFVIAGGLPDEILSLIERDTLPLVQSRSKNSVVGLHATMTTPHYRRPPVKSFLQDPDGRVIAGRFKRSASAETWFVPDGSDPVAWLRCALGVWAETNPKFKVEATTWSEDPRWMTPDEAAALDAVSEAEAERARVLEATDRRIDELRTAYDEQRERSDTGARRLLTVQGDELVAAVREALVDLGFGCDDMDASAAPGDKLEDLRVTDPADPEWVALVEVRGYKAGARLNDLLRLGRFVTRYALAEGRAPASTWYVVNSFLGSDPATRDVPLGSHPAEVAEFAKDGGLVIDTRDLFSLWRSVMAGETTKEQARALLKGTGRLELDATD